jgi:hypothetical protein
MLHTKQIKQLHLNANKNAAMIVHNGVQSNQGQTQQNMHCQNLFFATKPQNNAM